MIVRFALGALASFILTPTAHAQVLDHSLRPQIRPGEALVTRSAVTLSETPVSRETVHPGFAVWSAGFRDRARAAGIPMATLDAALGSARYLPDVIERDRRQSEFTKTIWQYLESAVSDSRVETGQAMLAAHDTTLDRIEARYGVDREAVLAIWGMESAYGAHRGNTHVVSALATLAFDGRRGAFFEAQLLAALEILVSGDTTAEAMTGSWAGAMGHTQFMPTSYQSLAVDFTGDGRRDIWSDDPTDALASTAAYLSHHGWIEGMPWGVEVTLPRAFDFDLAGREIRKMPSDWADLGVLGTDGEPVRNFGSASLFLPAGAGGAAFLTFKNFDVIKRYNPSDAYAMGVGHLADRIAGKGPVTGTWPSDERGLTFAERQELQRRLTSRGFDTAGIDGRIGPRTVAALRDFQRASGLAPDGFASLSMLDRLR